MYRNKKKLVSKILISIIFIILIINYIQLNDINHNLKESINEVIIRFPTINDMFEHLKNKKVLMPKILISKNRSAKFVIGIPSVKRLTIDNKEVSYLDQMLKSLFASLDESDMFQVLVVVLISEVIYFNYVYIFIFNFKIL
jgi:hypothetical protein